MYKVEDIEGPEFLKDLSIKELNVLSSDIRKFLIDKVSKTGGHLSSNLGLVELSIAIHYMFESPIDKIIFDVGHQGYVHKILTGRAKDFDTLRQYKGLSGFLKLNESKHDCFEAGHSSTSIAAVAGFEVAKTVDSSIGHVIGIIGDGALTGGLALEGLNFLGHYDDHNPIIFLNDNNMSITENVGHFSRFLNSMRINKSYSRIKSKSSILPKFVHRIKNRVKKTILVFTGSDTTFEDMGYESYGPVDGHDFKSLIKVIAIAKKSKHPCIIHVVTKKGKGYEFAENDFLGKWHGVPPFNVETGEFLSNKKKNTESWSNIVSDYLINYASNNEKFKVIVPAMISGCGLLTFKELFPNKIIDVGIAEQLAATLSAGIAVNGIKVFLPFYSTFAQRAYDQISHDIARQNLHIVIGLDRCGIVGADGDTHQGIYDIPMLRHIPNLVITMPYNQSEAVSLLDFGFNKQTSPFVIRYPRGNTSYQKYEDVIKTDIELGSWTYLKKGNKLTIVSYGSSLNDILDMVNEKGIDCNVVNARFIKPIDFNIVKDLVNNNHPIIVYEESIIAGGLGSSILEYLQSIHISGINISIMGIDDMYVEQGTRKELLKDIGISMDDLYKKINCL